MLPTFLLPAYLTLPSVTALQHKHATHPTGNVLQPTSLRPFENGNASQFLACCSSPLGSLCSYNLFSSTISQFHTSTIQRHTLPGQRFVSLPLESRLQASACGWITSSQHACLQCRCPNLVSDCQTPSTPRNKHPSIQLLLTGQQLRSIQCRLGLPATSL